AAVATPRTPISATITRAPPSNVVLSLAVAFVLIAIPPAVSRVECRYYMTRARAAPHVASRNAAFLTTRYCVLTCGRVTCPIRRGNRPGQVVRQRPIPPRCDALTKNLSSLRYGRPAYPSKTKRQLAPARLVASVVAGGWSGRMR